MSVKEHIQIHEKVTVFIRDPDGKVVTHVIKTPWHEKSRWDKLLTIFGLKKEPGSLNTSGRGALAKLYGGEPTASTGTAIMYLCSYGDAAPLYQVVTRVWADPVLTISNEGSPWTLVKNYVGIHLSDSTLLLYHTIGLGPGGTGSITIGSGYAWWVEVKLTFSGS